VVVLGSRNPFGMVGKQGGSLVSETRVVGLL